MKRVILTLAAGAFGVLLLVPLAHAQDNDRDYNNGYGNDNGYYGEELSPQQKNERDRQEQLNDLAHGNIGGALHEQGEIQQRRQRMNEERRYDGDEDYGNHRYNDDDDND
jgi:hypothetical protein